MSDLDLQATQDRVRELQRELAEARAENAALRNNQLGPVPDGPLKALGAWVASYLDEDRWATAERYLNAALAERDRLQARNVELRSANGYAELEAERDKLREALKDAVAELRRMIVNTNSRYLVANKCEAALKEGT